MSAYDYFRIEQGTYFRRPAGSRQEFEILDGETWRHAILSEQDYDHIRQIDAEEVPARGRRGMAYFIVGNDRSTFYRCEEWGDPWDVFLDGEWRKAVLSEHDLDHLTEIPAEEVPARARKIGNGD